MAAPITFPSTTAHFLLPLLFTGQAQKEFFLNQALSIIDAVLQGGVAESSSSPPNAPTEGSCYRVLPGATGDWAGKDDKLAVQVGGAWHFVTPKNGMSIYDRGTATFLLFDGGWGSATEPSPPSGGSTVDAEARTAISELIQSLREFGVFSG